LNHSKSEVKRLWLTGFAIIIAALFLTLVMGIYNSEPRYKGKSAAVWALDLNSSNQKDREEAGLALQKIGSNGVPSLSRMLVTTNHSWRDRALLSVTPHLPRPWRSRVYEKHYPLEPFRAQILAANALGVIGREARGAIPVLNEMLADPRMQGVLSDAAASALAKIGKDSVPTLLSDLQSTNTFMVQKATVSVGMMGPEAKDAIPTLAKQLASKDATTYEYTKTAISRIGSPAAVPSLLEILHNGSPEERALAAKALSLMPPSSIATIQSLISALDDNNPQVRRNVIDTLGDLRSRYTPIILALSRSLQDTNEEVRLEAVKMLGRAQMRAQPAVPQLNQLLNDTNDAVRSAAMDALKQITNHPPPPQRR
jgi:HEAT repeat protein